MEAKKAPSRSLSRAEGFSMITDYFRSGMGNSEYYRSHGMSEWQFYKWKKLYLLEHPPLNVVRKDSPAKETTSFRPLEIKDSPSSPCCFLPAIEIQYPSGICLRIAEGLKETSCLTELVNPILAPSCSR